MGAPPGVAWATGARPPSRARNPGSGARCAARAHQAISSGPGLFQRNSAPAPPPRKCRRALSLSDWSFPTEGGALGEAGCALPAAGLTCRSRGWGDWSCGGGGRRASGRGATRPSAAHGRTDAGSRPARHGDGEGVRADRQGRELGGHLPGAEPGPLGRAASPALRAQEPPVAPSRPRSGLTRPPAHACLSPPFTSSPEPPPPPRPRHGPATLCPHWSTPPLLPCLAGPDHLRPSSFVSRGGR